MIKLKDRYDTAILVSGDSDFAVVLDWLKEEHKRILVMSTRGRVAGELLERAKFIIAWQKTLAFMPGMNAIAIRNLLRR